MKVFRLNDCEWYMAETLEQAIDAAVEDSGLPRDEAADEDAAEVPPEKMNKLVFVEDDETTRSFAEELQRRIARGDKAGVFASTEY